MASRKNFKKGNGKPNCRKDNMDEDEQFSPSKRRSTRRRYDTKGSNDPAWYSTDPSLLRDAASIPFSWSVGTPIAMNYAYPSGTAAEQEFTDDNLVIPGLCVLDLIPTVGYAEDQSSPINVASTALYSFVRHANSGHANYDSPDLMVYCIAMANVYAYINFLQRIYGCGLMYDQRNRYLPEALVAAQDVNFDDLVGNLAQMRYGINMIIAKAASLAVPSSITYFNRQAFIYANIYCEGTSTKDQMYMYNPFGFLVFNEYEVVGGASGLTFKKFADPTTKYRVSDLIKFGNQMLQPILDSEDLNIMSGDILKAYGDGGIIKLAPLGLDYNLLPTFNIGVLEQMHNATITHISVKLPGGGTTTPTNNTAMVFQNSGKGWLQQIVIQARRR